MQKQISFENIKFSATVVRRAIHRFLENNGASELSLISCSATLGNERWNFDNIDEFFAQYQNKDMTHCALSIYPKKNDIIYNRFEIHLGIFETEVTVNSDSREKIESVFSIFNESNGDEKRLINEPKEEISEASHFKPIIFIGHGRNVQWKKLKDHLQDKHEITVEAYESGARSGHTIRDILDSMSKNSSFALLVLTGEDKTESGIRARQNVIHECGLFQGRLGFDRAIMLVENGVELASNFDGIQQLRFRKGRISETFGDVIATIRREFGPI